MNVLLPKKNIILVFFISSLSQIACGQVLQQEKLNYDESKIAIILLNPDKNFEAYFKDAKPASLKQADLQLIDQVLEEAINVYNKTDPYRGIITLGDYKRQYLTVMNSKGEKEVWVNCFCDTLDDYWKEQILIVADGGKCYFNLKINIDKAESYDLYVNGEA